MKRFFSLLTLGSYSLFCALLLCAQTSREEMYANLKNTAGVYLAYPTDKSCNTPVPNGYKPFYISHMGRHGSRYLINETDYTKPLNTLKNAEEANVLTSLGKQVLDKLKEIHDEADGRAGDLSPLGVEQHKAIAKRMYNAYPQVFTNDAKITAHSTMVMRCAMSMVSFCEGLKEKNPKLNIVKEPSNRHVRYLSFQNKEMKEYNSASGPWRKEYKRFEEEHTHPQRLMETLFTDTAYVSQNINSNDLMWQLYWITIDLQNVETPGNLYAIFTPEELFDLWQCFNYRMYAQVGNCSLSKGAVMQSSKVLLNDIITRADEKIKSGDNGADLRFGHDVNIIPLAAILGFEGCNACVAMPEDLYGVFADYKVSPMAANIQMILFRNKKGDVIAKFMHNEKEVAIPIPTSTFPFYEWDEVKAYYQGVIDN